MAYLVPFGAYLFIAYYAFFGSRMREARGATP
jgi:hypothetical protein